MVRLTTATDMQRMHRGVMACSVEPQGQLGRQSLHDQQTLPMQLAAMRDYARVEPSLTC